MGVDMMSTNYWGPRIVIYTALIGLYDDLAPSPTSAVPCLCVTDQRLPEPMGWRDVPVTCGASIDERIRLARNIKTHPTYYLPPHDISIWIDANLYANDTLIHAIDYLGGRDIATFAYPDTYGPRDCIYQEAAACIQRRKDRPGKILRQMERYMAEGYPAHNGLVETSIVVRQESSRARLFNQMWWNEIRTGSRRDQLSFNYVAWRASINYSILPGSRVRNSFSDWRPHRQEIYA